MRACTWRGLTSTAAKCFGGLAAQAKGLNTKASTSARSLIARGYREVLVAEQMTSLASYPTAEQSVRILALLTIDAAPTVGYVMSDHEEIDGVECSLSEGVMHVMQAVMPTIVVCSSALALFKAEQESGAAPMYLLRNGARAR